MQPADINEIEKSPLQASLYFRDGVLSLSAAAEMSGLPLSDFTQYLNKLNIEVVQFDETTDQEVRDISAWLRQQSPQS